MGDEVRQGGVPPEGSGSGQPVEDVWERLGRQLRELGTSVAEAVRSAADDPENQRRAREFKEGFDTMAREISDAFSETFSSEPGERVKEAAGAVAAAGRAVAEDVKPRLADFTRKASDVLRDTAARMDPKRDENTTDAPDDSGGGEP